MDLLARREHSFQELKIKLFRKFTYPKKTSVGRFSRDRQDASGLDQEPFDQGDVNQDGLNKEKLEALLIEQLSMLSKENLQSDERYVESFINGRKAQGKGPIRIRKELEQKGACSDLITDYLNESDEQWLDLAERVYKRKFGDGVAKSYEEKAKRMRFMLYRGFSHAVVQDLVR